MSEQGEFERRMNETEFLGDGRDVFIQETFLHIVKEARRELPSTHTLRELRNYLEKLYTYWNPLGNNEPIFSQRHYLGVIDKLIETQTKWFGAEEVNPS